MKPIAVLLGVALGVLSALTQANEFAELTVSVAQERNVARALLESDQEDAGVLSGGGLVGKSWQLAANTAVVTTASATVAAYPGLSGFNRLTLGTAVSLNHKFGLGPYRPRVSVAMTADRDLLSGDQRDRDFYALEVTIGRRWSRHWDTWIGWSDENSRGLREHPVNFDRLPYDPGVTRDNDPMDYYNRVVFGAVSYAFDNGWLLTGRYDFNDGYIVASGTPPIRTQFLKSKAVALDPAYDENRLLYLLKTDIDSWSATLSVPTGMDTAVDVGYSLDLIDAPGVGPYRHHRFSINLLHSF